MNCPSCGKELVDENGKLVCQGCGYGRENIPGKTPMEPVAGLSPSTSPDPSIRPQTQEAIPATPMPEVSRPNASSAENLAAEPLPIKPNEAPPASENPFFVSTGQPDIKPIPSAQMTGLDVKGKEVKIGMTPHPAPYLDKKNERILDDDEKVKIDFKLMAAVVIIAILIIITLVLGLIYYSKLTKVTMIGDKPTGRITQAEVTNCDEIGPSKQISDPTGKNQTCIKESFLQCKPAKINFASYRATGGSTASKPAPEILIEYQVVGPDNNLCTVKITYLKTPAPLPDVKEFDFNGKEMTCNFESAKDEVFQEVFGFTNGQYYTTLGKTNTQPEVKCSGGAYDLQQLMKKALNK